MKKYFMEKDGSPSVARLGLAMLMVAVTAIIASFYMAPAPLHLGAVTLTGFAFFGAVANASTIQSLGRGFKALFTSAYDAAEVALLGVAMEVTSTTGKEEYAWLNQIPGLRKWVGERRVNSLSASGYTIKNDHFEETLGVNRDDIEDDNLGMYSPIASMLGDAAKRHPGQLLAALLKQGETALCHDGKAFFATDHPNGTQAAFSNLFASKALNAANYAEVRAAMMSLKNESGDPLGIIPTTLIVPPQLEETARLILNADVILGDGTAGGSKTNVWKGSASLIVAAELADNATEWYLAALNRPVKPLIKQIRKQPEFVALTKPDAEGVFNTNTFQWGVDYRGAAGFGFPMLMSKGRA